MFENKYVVIKVLSSKPYKLENRAIYWSNQHLGPIYIRTGIQEVM